jgi:hypothetical protein
VLALVVLFGGDAIAADPPTVTFPGMRVGKGISDSIQGKFGIAARNALEKESIKLSTRTRTDAGLGQLGQGVQTCVDPACARELGKATDARFVVLGHASNTDEIYKVTLAVFDVAHDDMARTHSEVCELCAVEEVNQTIAKAVKGVADVFERAPPEPTGGSESDGLVVKLRSEPVGAEIELDGEVIGRTPLDRRVQPGVHVLILRKAGFEPEARRFEVTDVPQTVDIRLRVIADTSVATEGPAVPLARSASYATAGWVMTTLGVAGVVTGSILLAKDGDVTCDDGRGASTCPTVYDFKAVSGISLGLGGALLGAGVALLITDPGGVPEAGE